MAKFIASFEKKDTEMAQSLKARFEQLAADQTRDPNIEVIEHVETIHHEKPVPGNAINRGIDSC